MILSGSGYGSFLFRTAAIYLSLLLLFILFLFCIGKQSLIETRNLLQFDALLYQKISNELYSETWLFAFFPAFPFLWHFLSLSVLAVVILNSLLFILSSSFLYYQYKVAFVQQAFLSTLPILIFMFVPYSESLFYFASVLVIIGFSRGSIWLTVAGFILCSLIRPTTFVFIPAVLIAFSLTEEKSTKLFTRLILSVAALLLGLGITILIQKLSGGKWLIFFEAQKLWGNYLRVPDLPLKSWGGNFTTRLDASAIFVGAICLYFLTNQLFSRLKEGRLGNIATLFSALYVVGSCLIVLLFRGGSLFSLNRFVFATCFIHVVAICLFQSHKYQARNFWILLLASQVLWLLFGSYNHIQNFALYLLVSLYFLNFYLIQHPNKMIARIATSIGLTANIVLFLKLSLMYLEGRWIA